MLKKYIFDRLNLNSLDMSIVIDTKEHGFECAEMHHPLIYGLRGIMNKFKYCVIKSKYDPNL